MRQQSLKLLIIISFFLSHTALQASDLAKEKRWADQIVDSIMVGDAEWLSLGEQKVLAIYAENNTEKALGGAIILHGIGVHPNWSDVIHPLRTELPEYGWHTLSVQLPILPNEAEYKDYLPLFNEVAPRIDAAVTFFKAKGVKNIVIVAHSLGSSMAAYYLAQNQKNEIQAFVAIGTSVQPSDKSEQAFLTSLPKLKSPVLDIYGSQDLDAVVGSVKLREQTADKAGIKIYNQVEIEGANHFFVGKEEELVRRVRGWLGKKAAGTEIKK